MKLNFPKLFRRIARIIATLLILYVLSLVFVYFKQERFFFNPKTLAKDYQFEFEEPFEELNIPVAENTNLNAVLFKTENPKGVILYLHGNAGAIHDWGKRASLYLNNQYDILFVDYRGYGKSDGSYCNSEELFNDMQKVYDYTKTRYHEEDIVVLGFSLGSGLASYLASKNNPRMLILNAPYYSWKTLITEEIAPPIPGFIIKYDIPSYQFVKQVTCPIKIFYGTRDFLIHPDTNAKKLQALQPNNITLYPITDAGHNGLHITKQYYEDLKQVL
ncbi:alpha/beta hydrolase [Xanthomarina gelatinilytica]|uniref:alpha/beta hydrolase n=2 Tax=Xanthomarina gelatinilytica TaxID=1137281 RepID=UPI001DA98B46|nr:alpha/beta fold hydrolase [Winogradskyella sp.]MDX1316254.1 alpha/beta fold hydrolase [Xanthomarina gelatinilytica]